MDKKKAIIFAFTLVYLTNHFKESARSCCITTYGHTILVIFNIENEKKELYSLEFMHSQAHCHKMLQLQVDKTKLEDPKLCEFMVTFL